MDVFEVNAALENMRILVDTREQPSRQAQKRYEMFGVPYVRKKLEYGDYAFDYTDGNGKSVLYPDDKKLHPSVVVERKMGLEELSQCFCQSRKRFKAEFERIKEHGAKVYLLVENATFENLYNGRYGTKFHPNAFTASLFAYCARYDVSLIFCKAETSGKIIHDILYRELKERLESDEIRPEK